MDQRETVIAAAGCVLWRPAASSGAIEIALVHRPRWKDWSHPKGKLTPGETGPEAAVREVLEETGMRCRLGAPLTTVHYPVQDRTKTVQYWVAEAVDGAFTPNDEVDRVLWLSPPAARDFLTHPRDADLLAEALKSLGGP